MKVAKTKETNASIHRAGANGRQGRKIKKINLKRNCYKRTPQQEKEGRRTTHEQNDRTVMNRWKKDT